MEVTAILRKLRIAPRKVRVVADPLRGLTVEAAEVQLTKMNRNAAVPMLKLVQSAVANAEHNHSLKKTDLYIKTIRVDDGVTLKRWKPRAFGRAAPIRKRSSHVEVVLDVNAKAKAAARAQGKEKAKSEKADDKKPAAKKEEKPKKTTK